LKVIAVDDVNTDLQEILSVLNENPLISEVNGFESAKEAIEFITYNLVDVAFLDICMNQIDGLVLAKRIKEVSPITKIIFISSYSEYAVKAFKIHAEGYLLKPVTSKDIEEELCEIMKSPITIGSNTIFIQTFGNFEIFFGDEAVLFTRSKPKELLAYLVDRRGASVSAAEIAAVLWEDKHYDRYLQNQTQKIISFLMATLKQYGIQDIIIKKYNSISIDRSKVSCDYYSFLEGDINAIKAYSGEYMSNYSWSEYTASMLSEKK
jgi:two-component SAPR family response regulator